MKRKFILSTITLAMFVAIGFQSCDDNNGYSLGDFWVDIATVETDDNSSAYWFILDDGTTLWPAASDIQYLPKQGQRIILNYSILSDQKNEFDHYIKINYIWDILTKKTIVLTATNADSIGNDPVKINDMWIGNHYLNVDFLFNYGGIRPHAINLVENSLIPDPQDGKIHLEFRHNAYGSTNNRLYNGLVCFDLKPYQNSSTDSVTFAIKVLDWNTRDDVTYDIVYKYGVNSTENATKSKNTSIGSSFEFY
jgi:hypothetical protein